MRNFSYYILLALLKLSRSFKLKFLHGLKELRRILHTESQESVKMMEIYNRAISKKASREEIKWANEQLGDILKTVGLGALLILPFAPITLPLIIKITQKLGFSIFPSSFDSPKMDPKQDKKSQDI